MGNGDSVLGISGSGGSSLEAGPGGGVLDVSSTGRGDAACTGVCSPELAGSSGFATVSLPDVRISRTDNESDERRPSVPDATTLSWTASIEGGGTRLRSSADFDKRDEVRCRVIGVCGLTGDCVRLVSILL